MLMNKLKTLLSIKFGGGGHSVFSVRYISWDPCRDQASIYVSLPRIW